MHRLGFPVFSGSFFFLVNMINPTEDLQNPLNVFSSHIVVMQFDLLAVIEYGDQEVE